MIYSLYPHIKSLDEIIKSTLLDTVKLFKFIQYSYKIKKKKNISKNISSPFFIRSFIYLIDY